MLIGINYPPNLPVSKPHAPMPSKYSKPVAVYPQFNKKSTLQKSAYVNYSG
jgi:hypothetical protein